MHMPSVLLDFFIILVLATIVYQDLKAREVSIYLFPLCMCMFACRQWIHYPVEDLYFNTTINICFLLIQMVFIVIYFSIKSGKLINITQQHIGWGDLLFFCALTILMSPVNFILFLVSSLLVSVVAWFLLLRKSDATIPLAGIQALLLIMLIILNLFNIIPDFYTDWLIFFSI